MSVAPPLSGIQTALERIQQIQAQADAPLTAADAAAYPDAFQRALAAAGAQPASGPVLAASIGTAAPATATATGPLAQRIVDIAQAEVGVREQPPGSNDGPRIAQYRAAAGSPPPGPWCAYFASWVAAQAGLPLGDRGQGFGWVPDVHAWAASSGRWQDASAGPPSAGDLVVFDRNGDGTDDHIGVVTGVGADGTIQTVEGNSADAVSARSYRPGEGGIVGYVRLVAPGA